jgi:type I restriction enzyme S subunit
MIEAGNIKWDGVTYISDHVHRLLNKSHVRSGDILFSKIGSALGKGVVYDGSRGVCNSNAAVAKIDIDQRLAGRQFVTHFLNHDIAKVQLKNMIVSLLPRINLGDLNRLMVPCPTTDEQRQIENRLLSSDTAIKTEEVSLGHLRSVKTGLMQDLLTGKVRVKVDEAEEVAP